MYKPICRLLLCALLPLWSTGAGAIAFDEARHLLVRTGFEATPAAIERLKPLSYDRAVALILKETRTEAVTPPPDWSFDTQLTRPATLVDPDERQRAKERRRDAALELKGWWFRELRATPSPLTERMTLFWHGHFTSELRKVRAPQLMYRQNVLLRQHAVGNFKTLLHAVAKDAAMILYLDTQTSRKGHPNENFARELLELFTLGEGRYRERDVQEAARAFTGWRVNLQTGAVEFEPRDHDDGEKIVLGNKGRLDGDQVIDTLLRDPRTAEFLVRKLWREFIADKPDPKEVQRLAAEFRKNYEIKPLLRNLLMTRAFRAPLERGRLIKSPVELLVGTARQFAIPVGDGRDFVRASRALGQDLFDPPSVKGWSGGTAWIDSTTLLAREQMVARLLRGREEGDVGDKGAADLEDLTPKQLAALLMPIAPVDTLPTDVSTHDLAAHLVRDPTYQLK